MIVDLCSSKDEAGTVYFNARVRAFGRPLSVHRVSVDKDETVRVFDGVAKHYTTLHSMTKGQVRRVVRIAREID